ncbi:Lysine-specific demethylase [Nymphaea thermarum]|nr:Lysine-specific demethylase [Nymphaea thermarum]
MGTKCIGPQIGEGESGRPFSPDGLLSLTSFTLKKVHDGLEMNSVPPVDTSLSVQTDMESGCSTSDAMKLTRCLRRRPWINYGMFDFSSDEESDMENFYANGSPKPRLPKGVIRGCSNCNNCQKVIARWRPEDACRPVINEAPVFYPSEEEFKDTLKYIASIRQMVEPYGICRIIPPSSWKPPCPLKGKHIWENAKFVTRIQQLDKLQNREPMKKNSRMAHTRKKRRRCLKAGMPCGHGDPDAAGAHDVISQNEHFGFLPGPEFTLESFEKYADDFVEQYFGLKDTNPSSDSRHEPTCQHKPSVEDIEGEYWRMVEKPTEEIEVLYGADLETGTFGSGFPKALSGSGNSESEEYVRSGWNLNNFPRLAGSVLSFEKSDISGVLVPWLYLGMCFSSFCWHVEDHHLYSLNYMHWGAPKLWYGVPGSHALKLEAAMKKHLPHLFEEQPDLLHKLVTQLSPTILKSEGVPVYRCVQRSGEFVLTFPRAYHSGFNCGFNCAEAVNVAPIDWLPHGQSAVELYAQQHRKTSLSHDKLLLGAAQVAIKALWEIHFLRKETPDNLRWDDACGKDGILTMALKTRIDIERARRQFFCCPSQVRKMDVNFDATNERECIICFYDLHLSAAGCECSPETFACLNHAKQLCSCAWSTRFFLFRYELTELDICTEALGGKLSAIHRWANLYLGLSLSSHVTKNDSSQVADNRGTLVGNALVGDMKTKEERPVSDVPPTSNAHVDTLHPEMNKPFVASSSLGETKTKDHTRDLIGSGADHVHPELKAPGTDIASKVHISSKHNNQEPSSPNGSKFSFCKSQASDPNLVRNLLLESLPVCQLSEEDTSYTCENSSRQVRTSIFSPSISENKLSNSGSSKPKASEPGRTVICLSDDDDDCQAKGYQSISKVKVKVEESTTEDMKVSERFVATKNGSVGNESQGDPLSGIWRTNEPATNNGKSKQLGVPAENASGHLSPELISSSGDKRGTSNLSSLNNHQSLASVKGLNNHHLADSASQGNLIHSQLNSCGNMSNMQKEEKVLSDSVAVQVKNGSSMQYSLSPIQVPNLNRSCQQGFRSLVRYFSVRDPRHTCFYISEILVAGNSFPLFRVTLQGYPTEVFVNVSPGKCWDMVREKVNQEIARQHSQGRPNLPTPQPHGSVDGLEMFGLVLPSFLKKIESLDPSHLCLEYWSNQPSFSNSGKALPRTSSEGHRDEVASQQSRKALETVESVLKGLFKKANSEELQTLHHALSNENVCFNKASIIQALKEEIQERQQSQAL